MNLFSPGNSHQQDDRKNEIMQANKYSPKIFNDILSDSIDRILKGESAEILLWENPEMAGDLKPLFSMALSMKMFSKIQAPAEFKARARREFQELLKVKVNRD